MRHHIELFMWGFQAHFRESVTLTVRAALAELGVNLEPDVVLVGFRVNGAGGHPVCIEPEDGPITRIDRERDRVLSRYRGDRDTAALELAMRELDRQEANARRGRREEGVPADVAVKYLQELPETWRLASAGLGRRQLASALFERIEVLGLREAKVYLTAEAARHGFAAALPKELGISVNGRGERI